MSTPEPPTLYWSWLIGPIQESEVGYFRLVDGRWALILDDPLPADAVRLVPEPTTSDCTYIVDFGVDGLYGPFPSNREARDWANENAAQMSGQRMCVIRPVQPAGIKAGDDVIVATKTPRRPGDCECCEGDPMTVCAACLSHSCWAGIWMCEDSRTAGTVQLDEGPW